MTEEKPTMVGERVCENTMREAREYKWEPSDKDDQKKCARDDPELEYLRRAIQVASKQKVIILDDRPKVATIECEVMEKALTYICDLLEELEQAIEHSEPIKQGIYLERLRNAILSQREEMVRRRVENEMEEAEE